MNFAIKSRKKELECKFGMNCRHGPSFLACPYTHNSFNQITLTCEIDNLKNISDLCHENLFSFLVIGDFGEPNQKIKTVNHLIDF